MDANARNEFNSPKRLKTLASNVEFFRRNTFLHQFVLDNSEPHPCGSPSYINAVLLSISDLDVNAANGQGYTPLHLAVLSENLLMVKKLLSCLPDIDVNRRMGMSNRKPAAIHMAVETGNIPLMEELLNKGADVNLEAEYGTTALCFAAMNGNLDMVQFLVNKGANVNVTNSISPLIYAAHAGHLDIAEFLVSRGADPNAGLPANRAALSGHLDVLKFFVDKVANADMNSILEASGPVNLDILKYLIDKGAAVNTGDIYGRTPLHRAIKKSADLAVVEFLLSKGADLKAQDERGRTPLHTAVLQHAFHKKGRSTRDVNAIADAVDIGTTHNCDIDDFNDPPTADVTNRQEKTLQNIRLLLSRNADVSIKDHRGETPLSLAMRPKNDSLVGLFLEKAGNNVNAQNERGETFLHAAVWSNNIAYTQSLLRSGADVNLADRKGWSPLHVAAHKGRRRIIRVLVKRGAKRYAKNKNGKTPLDLAEEKGNQLCIHALRKF